MIANTTMKSFFRVGATKVEVLMARTSGRYYSVTAVRLDTDMSKLPAPQWFVPREERQKKDQFLQDAALGETRLLRNNRLCPTRELNFTNEQWAKHKSPYRRIRHIVNTFRSSPFQRLAFPDMFMTASIAAGLTYYNEFIACSKTIATMNMSGFAGATTAIGLLAGFRLNASYGRYEECRIFWGDTNNTIRDLAGQTMMWMKDADQRSRMLKLCKAYPVCLNFHLSSKGGHHNMLKNSEEGEAPFSLRILSELRAELLDIYSDGKDMDDLERLCQTKANGGNLPLETLTCMRETIAGSVGSVDAIYVRELDEQCQRLCAAFGASERVLRTPLPTGFTRHSSRLLFLWSNCLPFALYPAMGPWLTLPTSLLTMYAICGVEDIGVQLEEPFNILPMRQYSDGMFDAIGSIERNYTPYTPPSVAAAAVAAEATKAATGASTDIAA